MAPSLILHAEVCLKNTSGARLIDVEPRVRTLLSSTKPGSFASGRPIDFSKDSFLAANVQHIFLYSGSEDGSEPSFSIPPDTTLRIHLHQLNEDEIAMEEIDEQPGEDSLPAYQQLTLPSRSLHGLWESLVLEGSAKEHLLGYGTSALLFSDKQVNTSIISWNRVVLLHGPPGTGKTSLCKAFAHKLCIRLSHRYTSGQLIEVNAHSLFSKWFSESGKLVMKLFSRIREIVDDKDSLVCVLIDEVESLSAARKNALSGSEPSDAIRVVNALLTQLDQLKDHPNVMVLTTSNITGAIDVAFVDRADLKLFIGLPSLSARYHILSTCINELLRVGIVQAEESSLRLLGFQVVSELLSSPLSENTATKNSLALCEISRKCEGLSGRALRKLPFVAHASYLKSATSNVAEFLTALSRAVDRELEERSRIERE